VKILDTVALVSYIEPNDPFHEDGKKHVRSVTTTDEVFVPSVALLELDIILKSRGFSYDERKRIFELLSAPIPSEKVLRLTTSILKRAVELDRVASWRRHYFDVLIASLAREYAADVVTTDIRMSKLGVNISW